MRTFASSIAIAALAIAFAMPPALGQNRLWVSHNGSADNRHALPACNPQQPCDSFFAALTVAPPGSEINCLDSGNYELTGTITQSVTIDCGGALGGITSGITIAGANIVVKLRNLTINGVGSDGAGVSIKEAGAVIIENCVIQDFTGNGGGGIFVQTNQANTLQLNVSDTLIANNTDSVHNLAILIAPTGGGTTIFALDRVRVEKNTAGGITVDGTSATGDITGVIRDSLITGSTNGDGIRALANAAEPPPGGIKPMVTVSLDHTDVAGNLTGVTSAVTGAAVILNNSTIQTNGFDRDRGEPRGSAPPTPPYVRVRIRRFEKLR
jgi:hypothetical protein